MKYYIYAQIDLRFTHRLRRLPALNQHLINVSCFPVWFHRVGQPSPLTGYIQDSQYCHDVLVYCWVIIFDDEPALNQYWFSICSDQRCVCFIESTIPCEAIQLNSTHHGFVVQIVANVYLNSESTLSAIP